MNIKIISELMHERGMTRVELAEKTGLSESTVRRVLKNEERSMNFTTAELIADALDVPLARILDARHLMSPSERAAAENVPVEMPIAVAEPEVVISNTSPSEIEVTPEMKIAVMRQMLIERSLMLNDANDKLNFANDRRSKSKNLLFFFGGFLLATLAFWILADITLPDLGWIRF